MTELRDTGYTPPLGYHALTPLYDAAIALTTRERVWRAGLVTQIDPQPEDRILDVGCGTGTLALALHAACPDAAIAGLDPDGDALDRARAKASAVNGVQFINGFMGEASLPWKPNKIVSSLVFHQVPTDTKRSLLAAIAAALAPDGTFHLADYSVQQSWAMRLAFRLTVQMLDGRRDTQPNADGVLEPLMRAAGLTPELTRRIATPTGSISLYLARRGSAIGTELPTA